MPEQSPGLGENTARGAAQSTNSSGPQGIFTQTPAAAGNPTTEEGALVSDIGAVHANGQFYSLPVGDFLGNPAAIKFLLNEKKELQQQLARMLDPVTLRSVTIITGLVNVCAAVFVGVGVNMVTSNPILPVAPWILGLGIFLTLTSALAPILVSIYGSRRAK